MANWILVKVLGRGSYGVVYLAKLTIGCLDYYFAVKVTQLQYHSSLSKEEQILKHFKGCPEIVQCFGSVITMLEIDSSRVAFYNLKLEYAAGGTLADLIRQRKKLPENEVKEYLKMILRGLSCIHGKGFVHVDLKPDNILAFPQSDGTMKLKIADFGLSMRCGEKDDDGCAGIASFRGTPKYMSPESIIFSEVNSALDIWSLGCILVEMVSGKSVWHDCPSREELMKRLLDDMEIPEIPSELSEEGKDFIGKCFDRVYKQRWTADMLLEHSYLNEEKKARVVFLPRERLKSKTESSHDGIFKLPKENYLPHLLYKSQSKF